MESRTQDFADLRRMTPSGVTLSASVAPRADKTSEDKARSAADNRRDTRKRVAAKENDTEPPALSNQKENQCRVPTKREIAHWSRKEDGGAGNILKKKRADESCVGAQGGSSATADAARSSLAAPLVSGSIIPSAPPDAGTRSIAPSQNVDFAAKPPVWSMGTKDFADDNRVRTTCISPAASSDRRQREDSAETSQPLGADRRGCKCEGTCGIIHREAEGGLCDATVDLRSAIVDYVYPCNFGVGEYCDACRHASMAVFFPRHLEMCTLCSSPHSKEDASRDVRMERAPTSAAIPNQPITAATQPEKWRAPSNVVRRNATRKAATQKAENGGAATHSDASASCYVRAKKRK